MDTSDIKWPQRKRRGRYSNEFKQKLVEACNAPGTSVAAIALANGINANLLRRWISERTGIDNPVNDNADTQPLDPRAPGFIRINNIVSGATRPEAAFELRLSRGDLQIVACGSSVDCAAFVRALLE